MTIPARGDRILVKASEALGTDEVMGTILQVFPDYLVVNCDDGDLAEVAYDGTALIGPEMIPAPPVTKEVL